MAASLTFRSLVALLLVVSVGIKLTIRSQPSHGAVPATESPATGAVAAFLDRHGFRVNEADSRPESPVVFADAGTCRLLAVLAAPEGWHRELVRRLASPDDQVFFVFDGTVYPNQPVWRTWIHHIWGELNRYIGLTPSSRPVVGVIASPSCDLRNMPWRELAAPLPR
ncbi:MAG TPA: hypothetical protein VJ779_02735 [Acetobacteraceae bacterium]|nr:hypothetical protein [Acetobacteraceae bacterium]